MSNVNKVKLLSELTSGVPPVIFLLLVIILIVMLGRLFYHIIITDLDNLKLIIDGHVGLAIKVFHGDVEAVVALGGELVKIFKAQPQLT